MELLEIFIIYRLLLAAIYFMKAIYLFTIELRDELK